MAAETIIQIRRGLAATWTASNPVLAAGEMGVETDTRKMKIGDGSTAWNSLSYFVKQIDNILLNSNTISSVNEDGNITLDPNGTGIVSVQSDIVSTGNVYANTNKLVATQEYVDSVKQALDIKNSVRASTTANVTLSGTQTIDGVELIAGDRVLVKNQETASENGIYVVDASTWSRSDDANSNDDVNPGMFVFVEEGTSNADSGWVLVTDGPVTLGSTSLSFTQFNGAGQVTAGDGLAKTGNTLNVGGTADRIVANADSIDIASTYAGQSSITTLGTVTTGTWNATAIDNAYLANSDVSFGGVTVSLGSTDATPAFDLTDATKYPGDSSLVTVGTVTTGTWNATAIDNAYLANSDVSFGGVTVSLGSTDATPAFDLVDATNYPGDSSLATVGTITTGTWNATPVDNAYLANSDVSFGGVTVSLGSSDATPAFDLADATNYPGDSSLVTVGTVTSGTWNATAVGPVYGGTGLTTYAAGDLLYASASNTLAALAKGTGYQFLKMNSAGTAPEWSNSLDGGTP